MPILAKLYKLHAHSFILRINLEQAQVAGRKPSLKDRMLFLPCNTDVFPPRISKRDDLRCT